MRLVIAALFAATACATPALPTSTPPQEGSGTRVNATEFGESWPLTVSEGWLRCEPSGAVIFRDASGADYAVNDEAAAAGFVPIDPLLVSAPASPERDELTPLIQLGLVLC
jgi:hypothetical protein